MISLKKGNIYNSDCNIIVEKGESYEEKQEKERWIVTIDLEQSLENVKKEIIQLTNFIENKKVENEKQNKIKVGLNNKLSSTEISWGEIYNILSDYSIANEQEIIVYYAEKPNDQYLENVTSILEQKKKEREKEEKELRRKGISGDRITQLQNLGKREKEEKKEKRKKENELERSLITLEELKSIVNNFEAPGFINFIKKTNMLDEAGIDYEDITNMYVYMVYIKEGIALVPYHEEPDVSYRLYGEPRMLKTEDIVEIEESIEAYKEEIKSIEEKSKILGFALEKQRLRKLTKRITRD